MDIKNGIADLIKIVGASAPLLGSVLGGNYAMVGLSLLSKLLGTSTSVSDILSKISSTSDVATQLRTLEDQHCEILKRLSNERFSKEVEDRANALDWIKNIVSLSNLFKSGWIPLAGWSAGFLVMLYYFPQIIIITYVWGKNCVETGIVKPFPMKPDEILNLIYLLFGFGTHHIFNKFTSKKD